MGDEQPPAPLETRIYVVRGQKIMLGPDLAEIFGVQNFRLNEAVKRNQTRFPDDFLFKLTREGVTNLTSQIAISRSGWGGRRSSPYAFTEHGALMLAGVLNSPRAVEMSIHVVRAFVRLRQMIQDHQELVANFSELEHKVFEHDEGLHVLVAAVEELMDPPPEPERPRIGFSQADTNLPT